MEKQGAAEFITATAADEGLQTEWSATETPAELIDVGRRHGYAFDVQELETAMRSSVRLRTGELDDDDLQQATGGLLTLSVSRPGPLTTVNRFEGWPCKWATRLGGLKGLGSQGLPPR